MKAAQLFFTTLSMLALTCVANVASAACSAQNVTLSEIPAWMPPVAGSGCTTADATALDAALSATNATAASIEGSVSAACKSCIFTESISDTSWQLIVWNDKSSVNYIFNGGACLAVAGASHSCASAFTTAYECEQDACNSCTDQTDYDNCAVSADTSGGCVSSTNAESTSCGTSATAALNACNYGTNATQTITPLVLALCGAASPTTTTTNPTQTGTPTNGVGQSTGSGTTSNSNDGDGEDSASVVQLGDTPPAKVGGCSIADDARETSYASAIALAFACAMIVGKIKRRSR